MQAIQNGRFLNLTRAAQIFEELEDPAERYHNYEEWELQEGAQARLNQGEATISPPNETAFRAPRVFGHIACSVKAPNHIAPGAPGGGAGRLYQFVTQLSFLSKRFEGN